MGWVFTGLLHSKGEKECVCVRVHMCTCVSVRVAVFILWLVQDIWEEMVHSINYYPVAWSSGMSYAKHAFHNCTSITLHPQQFRWALFPATLKLLNEMCTWEAWYGTEKKWTELSFRKEGWETLTASSESESKWKSKLRSQRNRQRGPGRWKRF